MRFLHLSDLHFREHWDEELGQVLPAFLDDVKDFIEQDDTYLIFSGDIVQAGSDVAQYSSVESGLLQPLAALGIGPEKTIMVPGNHGVDGDYVRKNIDSFLGLSAILVDETQSNNFILRATGGVFSEKFGNYALFEACNSSFGCGATITGAGYTLPDGTGVYCLNSALMSLGGQRDSFGATTSDLKKLAVETRGLNHWLNSEQHKTRVMVVHHPTDWLRDWANTELSNLVQNHFDVCVHGHVHEQALGLSYNANGQALWVTSPALFTRKNGELGYSIIEIAEGAVEIRYRQWSKKFGRFVSGVAYSGTDDGIARIQLSNQRSSPGEAKEKAYTSDEAVRYFDATLKAALQSYGPHEPIWVTPDLSETSESARNSGSAVLISADQLLQDGGVAIIKSPPQYGLSSTGLFIALNRARSRRDARPLFTAASTLPSHESGIRTAIEEIGLTQYGDSGAPDAIIVDEFYPSNPIHIRKYKNLRSAFPNSFIILLTTVDDIERLEKPLAQLVTGEAKELYLWALSRSRVRVLVQEYIGRGSKLQEDTALGRLIEHLDALNLPRTAHNCLTLLTIFESQIDATPVNRTEVMGLFLQALFNAMQEIPKYNSMPDLKDSLFALGYLCESFIREHRYEFTKKEFFDVVGKYCSEQLIEIEIDTLFFMLCACNMLVKREDKFYFRFVYWIHFFAAHRMHHSKDFYSFVMADRRYASYPEIIEFYSGIDRRSTEMLSSLLRDLSDLNGSFEERTGFSDDFDAFEELLWAPNDEAVEEVRKNISEEVQNSNLPVEVKDAIADKGYDRSAPYTQKISHFLNDASMSTAVQVMKCAARALRNSDHADVDVRRNLLDQVMRTCAREVRLLAVLSPILAKEGRGDIDGLHYYLTESFDRYEGEEKWIRIMANLHFNVSNFYGRDIYSAKLGPLYTDFLARTKDRTAAHLMVTQLVREKPKAWSGAVEVYVQAQGKNSFYLSDTARELKRSFDVGFNHADEKGRLRHLVGLAYGRHFRGNHPMQKTIEGIAVAVLDKKEGD